MQQHARNLSQAARAAQCLIGYPNGPSILTPANRQPPLLCAVAVRFSELQSDLVKMRLSMVLSPRYIQFGKSARFRMFYMPVAVLLVAMLATSCDSGGTEEVELPFARISIRLVSSEAPDATVAIAASPDFMTGTAAIDDTLFLEPGATYQGALEVFDSDGSNVTSRIRDDAEGYQFLYGVLGISGITLAVTDKESSYGGDTFGADLPVGLRFQLIVGDGVPRGDGSVRLRFGAFDPDRKNGVTLDGPAIIDVELPVFIDAPLPPIPNERITRATLTLERSDATEKWIIEAINTFTLDLGTFNTPDNLTVIKCVSDGAGGAEECGPPPFSDPDYFTLLPGEYVGSWELHDVVANEGRTDEIRDAGFRHLMAYRINTGAGVIATLDSDQFGSPLGLEFRVTVPENTIVVSGLVAELIHFDETLGESKAQGSSSSPRDMHFRMPMQVHQNGPVEDIRRLVLRLEEDGTDVVTTVDAYGDEVGVYQGRIDSLVITRCDTDSCVRTDSLELAHGSTHTGEFMLYGADNTTTVMTEVKEEGHLHEFVVAGPLEGILSRLDTDLNGRPIGFEVSVTVPGSGEATGSARITLAHYGRAGFKEQGPTASEPDVDFYIPVVFR